MQFKVNMKHFRKNWVWDEDTVHYGDLIAKTNGNFFTFNGEVYKRLLSEFCIFFTAK